MLNCQAPSPLSYVHTDNFLNFSNNICTTILNSVVSLSSYLPKLQYQPWLNQPTWAFRQQFRKTKGSGKKTNCKCLMKFYDILYQEAVKALRNKHFSNLISSHSCRLRILFSTINSVLNPTTSILPSMSTTLCHSFLKFSFIKSPF